MKFTTDTLASVALLSQLAIGASDSAEKNYGELPKGVLHFPLTRRQGIDKHGLFRRDDNAYGISLSNQVTSFSTDLKMGSQNQDVSVLVDTGSSDLWVMASDNPYCASYTNSNSASGSQGDGQRIKCYRNTMFDERKSSSFHANSTDFSIVYGDGTFANGSYAQDTVKYGSVTLKNANFALANKTDSSVSVWGIGLPGLEATVQTYDETGFSPVYANLPQQMKQQGFIETVAYSLWLNDINSNSGNLLFGGIDHARYSGDLNLLPMISSYPGAKPNEFNIKLDKISLYQGDNKADIIQCSELALLDSGTSYMMLPPAFLRAIVGSIGGECDKSNGCVAECGLTGGLTFDFQGVEISVPFEQIELQLGNNVCLLGMLPSDRVILGDTFLRSAYVVYDLDNYQIGLAKTNVNATTSNLQALSSGIPSATSAPRYTDTGIGNTYSTSFATFFTDPKGNSIKPSGSAGTGGEGTASAGSAGAPGPGAGGSGGANTDPFGQLTGFQTTILFTGGGGSSQTDSNGRQGKNGAMSMGASNAFGSLFSTVMGLMLYWI